MKANYILLIALVLPSLVLSQNENDALEAAKLGLIEKIYERTAEHYRKQLDAQGLSDEEVDTIIFDAIDAYAWCSVLVVQAQAREQGISEDVILKGIGTKTRGKEESLILLALDMEALREKGRPCTKALGEKLRIAIHQSLPGEGNSD